MKSKQIEYEAIPEARPEWLKAYNFPEEDNSIEEIKQQMVETKQRGKRNRKLEEKLEQAETTTKAGKGMHG